jgi:hypothetical protein
MKILKNNVCFACSLVVAFVLGSVACLAVLAGLLFSSFDTEYAAGLTRASWGKVQLGMSEQQVKALIGEPLEVDTYADSGERFLRYSRSPSSTHYWRYWIVVQDDRVVQKKKEIYWD